MRLLVEDDRIVIMQSLLLGKLGRVVMCWNTDVSVLWVVYWAKNGKIVSDVILCQLHGRTVLLRHNTNISHLFSSVQQ